MKGRPVVARAIAPRTPWADLSKTGDNAGVDGAVVLLVAVAAAHAMGGSWLSRPLGAPTRYCTGGSDWRISGEHGLRWECHGPHKQLGVVLMANPDGVRALTRR